MGEMRCILTFPTTHEALKAETVAKSAGLRVKMIPVPRTISPDCALGMQAGLEAREAVESALRDGGVGFTSLVWDR